MPVAYAIPRPSEPVLDANGHFTVPWQNYLRTRFGDAAASEIIAALEAQVADLLARVEELEDGQTATITGPQSVSVVGSLANGLVQITLVNDEDQPLPVSFYATDESSNKGWQLLQPDWVPNPYATYLVDEDGDYLIDENGNFLVSDTGFPLNPDFMPAPHQLICGQEYLYAFHTKLMAGTTAKMVFSGDSTTEGGGTGATGDYIISTAMLSQGTAKGHKLTSVNAGHSGESTLDWITTYLATDLAAAPDLYVVRWGLNDPFYGMDITDFETNLRSGLATIRASYGVDDMSVVVMVPNTANDVPNGRDAQWLRQVRVVARQAAKDYLCAFIDTYSIWPDAVHAAGLWMDDPFGDGRAIHPKNVFNAWIVTKMAELIFPAFLDAPKWGTYTPTLTNGANVASSTASQCQWSRTGNVVTVSGRVDIACTAAANTLTIVGMSLPVASNLTLSGNLAGGGAIGQTTYQTFICLGDTTNDRATLQFLSNGTTSAAAFFSFTYLVQ